MISNSILLVYNDPRDVIPAPIFIGINSSGNPGAVPAKAGIHYKEHGFLFAQETLDSPVSSTGSSSP
jgi:hypothetical protein